MPKLLTYRRLFEKKRVGALKAARLKVFCFLMRRGLVIQAVEYDLLQGVLNGGKSYKLVEM